MSAPGSDFALLILRRAQKQLAALPEPGYARVKSAVYGLASDPRPRGSMSLSGRNGRRLRVGVYRVIYEIDYSSHTVTVFEIGHRRDVYR